MPRVSDATDDEDKPTHGKGRPTPSRKEAEAARKQRMKTPKTRKDQMKAQRQRQADARREWRERMKDGDEAAMLKRDQGPVRKFARDYVDRRFSFIEYLLPLFVIILLLGFLGPSLFGSVERANNFSSTLLLATTFVLIFESLILNIGVKRQAKKRFPEERRKWLGLYTVMRASQMRILRIPKPRIPRGAAQPSDY